VSVETAEDDFGGVPATRRLGRTLRRHRRLRIGLTQLAYVVGGIVVGLVLPRIPVGFTVPRAETTQMLFAVPGWDEYVALAVDEIVEAGAGNVRIRRRVERLLQDLNALAPEQRRAPLQTRLDDMHARWPAPNAGVHSLIPRRS
jgi:hypothetical protein